MVPCEHVKHNDKDIGSLTAQLDRHVGLGSNSGSIYISLAHSLVHIVPGTEAKNSGRKQRNLEQQGQKPAPAKKQENGCCSTKKTDMQIHILVKNAEKSIRLCQEHIVQHAIVLCDKPGIDKDNKGQ